MVMGRNGYGPKWSWAEMVMGRNDPESLKVLDNCLLEQMVTSPTRGQNILDLFLTTNPTLVDNVSITPGLSDHDIVLIQVNVKPNLVISIYIRRQIGTS